MESGVRILLDISSQNSYAVFCFIKRRLNTALRLGWRLPCSLREAGDLGQKTASGAYAFHTVGRGPAASGFAGRLAVHVAGARRGDPAPAADVGSAARESECRSQLAARADARLFPVRSAYEAS